MGIYNLGDGYLLLDQVFSIKITSVDVMTDSWALIVNGKRVKEYYGKEDAESVLNEIVDLLTPYNSLQDTIKELIDILK